MSDKANWEIADGLRQRARDDLFNLLKSIDGPKDLYIDADLFPLIDLTSNASEIRQYGVGNLHKLDSVLKVQAKNKHLFLLRPNMVRFLTLAKQLRQLDIRNAHVICVPRKFYAFEHLLEQEGLWGRCMLHELTSFDMVPVDYDLFSMVNSHLYLNIYLDHSTDWLSTLAASLIDFQQLFGRFSNTLSFGKLAGQVARQLERGQNGLSAQGTGGKQIQTVVLFDRSVDLITPFCSQMCYEGLLDEYFNIEGGRMKLPKDGNADNSNKQFEYISLSTKDDIMIRGIRAMHFTKVFQEIKAILTTQNSLQDTFRDKMQSATIGDLKELVKNDVKDHLTAKRQLTRHLDLCTEIYEKKKASDFKIQLEIEADILYSQNFDEILSYIHTMICRCEPNKYRVLQLLCLLSTANNGLTREAYELLCRSFLQAYGYENIPFLYKLEQLHLFYIKRSCDIPISTNSNTAPASRGEALLKKGKQVAQNLADKAQAQTQKTFFQFIRKRLNLTPDNNQQLKTTPGPDMADVFGSMYVPLSCRLIEEGLTNASRLSAFQHELIQRGYPGAEDLFSHRSSGISTRTQYHDNQHSVLVVFIGGCTQSEINALRMLAMSKSNTTWQFYFAPTSIWTHTRLLQEIEVSQ